jgi:hypothetical protein
MRRTLALAAIASLGAAHCADDTTVNPVRGPAPGFSSGSRLRAKVRTEDGNAHAGRLFAGWHDARLDVPCRFTADEDGVTRCFPIAAELVIAFADAACTDAVALGDASCGAVPAYASVSVAADGCEGAARAFRVGAPRDTPGKLYALGGARCDRIAAPSGTRAYALEALDPSELLAARVEREATTPRLGLEVLVAADGAREARRIVDAERGPCFSIAGAVGGGLDRCVPDAVAWATYAADAACSAPLAYQVRPSSACPRADVVVAYGQDGCTVRTQFFAPGPDVGLDRVYVPPACTPLRAEPDLYKQLGRDHVFYGVGAPLADDALARLSTITVGDGRLALPLLADLSGTPLLAARPDTLYDTGAGAACRVVAFSDGAARCVPTDAIVLVLPSFADAACAREIVSVPRSSACPSAPAPTIGLRATTDTCTTTVYATEAVHLGAPFAPTAYYTKDADGACTEHATTSLFAPVLGVADALPRVREVIE